jgi:hypothetical protein
MSEIPVTITKEEFTINFDKLLNQFNFQKVRDIMILLDWKWSMKDGYKIPEIIDMQRMCSDLFTHLNVEQWEENQYDKLVSSGGFELVVFKDGDVELSFYAVRSSYVYSCQKVI